MRCHRTAFPDPAVYLLGRLMLLAGASVVSLAIGVATVQGDQDESGQLAIEEPRALQTPVTLLPVTPGATEEFLQPAMSPAGPVVRLAPELLAHQPPRDRTASQAMEGVRAASFQGVTPGETTREQLVGKLGSPARGI